MAKPRILENRQKQRKLGAQGQVVHHRHEAGWPTGGCAGWCDSGGSWGCCRTTCGCGCGVAADVAVGYMCWWCVRGAAAWLCTGGEGKWGDR